MKMSKLIKTISLSLIFVCFVCFVGYSQASTATLSGTVQDEQGAVVPGASVTIVNTGTGARRTATTNNDGYFTFPFLSATTYNITIEHQGFTPVAISDLVLNVGDKKGIQIQLKVGAVNAPTVNVSAEDVVETRTDGSVGTVINRQQIENMPLNGRSLQSLIQLTPGVVLTSDQSGASSASGGGQFSVNGQRTTSNYFLVDGVSANTGIAVGTRSGAGATGAGTAAGTTALGGTNSLVALDALQEFRVDTSTFAPEFGRTPGAQISLLTRSGTNGFHGSISEYFRNEAMDANDWFLNRAHQAKPRERQNLFGGVLGGPIYLPRFGEGGPSVWSGKNRLFFFASYEGLRLEQPVGLSITVPTLCLRGRGACPNGQSPAIAALQPYLNALPLPNGPEVFTSCNPTTDPACQSNGQKTTGVAQFTAGYSNPGRFDIFALRLDARLSDRLTTFFRLNHAPSESDTRTAGLSTVQKLKVENNSYTGGLTWVVLPNLTGDLRVNWTRNAPTVSLELDSFGGAIVPNVADIFAPGRGPTTDAFQFSAINAGRGFNWGAASADVQRQFNIVGTLAWVLRTHQLKFGIDSRETLPILGLAFSNEILRFSTLAQIQANRAAQYQIFTIDRTPREPVFSNLSLFGQDTWRASKHLTITYGLRFERVPPPTISKGKLPRTLLGIEGAIPQNLILAPEGTPLWHSRFGSFAPRFGVSYQLGSRTGRETTVRGGLGLFYDLQSGDVSTAFGTGYPYLASTTITNVAFPLSPAQRVPPDLGSSLPGTLTLMDPNIRLPYTVQWNTTLQQGLGSGQILSASYIGAEGRRLIIQQTFLSQTVAGFPNHPTLAIQRSIGRSTYKGLQIQYQNRLSHGIQALASYTLSSSKDNASFGDVILPATQSGQGGDVLSKQFGPSDFDVRHVFSAAVSYELPRFSGPKALRAVFNGWGSDLLIRYQSAPPVEPNFGQVFLPDGTFYFPRPNSVPGQPLYIQDPTVPRGRRFNPAAFSPPPDNQQGDFPRNGLRGFSASQVDLALRREFKLGERLKLQLRGELFNLFNHPSFGGIVNDLSQGTLFGQPTQMLNRTLGGGLNALYQMGGPRSGQLAVKLVF
jgi:hypothetical protein